MPTARRCSAEGCGPANATAHGVAATTAAAATARTIRRRWHAIAASTATARATASSCAAIGERWRHVRATTAAAGIASGSAHWPKPAVARMAASQPVCWWQRRRVAAVAQR